jgi:hypothetical protein
MCPNKRTSEQSDCSHSTGTCTQELENHSFHFINNLTDEDLGWKNIVLRNNSNNLKNNLSEIYIQNMIEYLKNQVVSDYPDLLRDNIKVSSHIMINMKKDSREIIQAYHVCIEESSITFIPVKLIENPTLSDTSRPIITNN